jgi:hypothetical protein
MKEGYVTIKAHELDRLLQLALLGNQVRSRDTTPRLPAAAVERLQSLTAPHVREQATLADSPRNRATKTEARISVTSNER